MVGDVVLKEQVEKFSKHSNIFLKITEKFRQAYTYTCLINQMLKWYTIDMSMSLSH